MDKIIAIASGKGGVGKSTVAANLAVSLANFGVEGAQRLNVALVDVDFYGPSIPTLMGGGKIGQNEQGMILPALKYQVKFISIAFFLHSADDPVIWRGPMLGKGIEQLFHDVDWGPVDICLIDLPPGTGDVQLSLSQLLTLDGAVMVTTPQEVALTDVRRAVNMFRKVNVDVIGVVENMSGFVTPAGESFDIFGQGGGESLAKEYEIPFLGFVPIDMALRVGGDKGEPAAIDKDSPIGGLYRQVSQKLWDVLKQRKSAKPRLNVVN